MSQQAVKTFIKTSRFNRIINTFHVQFVHLDYAILTHKLNFSDSAHTNYVLTLQET